MKIITSRTRILDHHPTSVLILQPCGCKYWYSEKRKLCRHVVLRIRTFLRHTGKSQKHVAGMLEISQATVSEALAGKRGYFV